MDSLVSTLLDALLILLIIVFVFVAMRRLVLPPRKTEAEIAEEKVSLLLNERSRIKENELAAQQAFLKAKISEKQFREIRKANLAQLKSVERELKQLGVF